MAFKINVEAEINKIVLRGKKGEKIASFDVKLLQPAEFEKIIKKHQDYIWDSPTRRAKKERFTEPNFSAISEDRFCKLIIDWQGIVGPDGKEFPCTEENKKIVYQNNPALVEWFFSQIEELTTLQVDKLKGEEKNSGNGPNGEKEK